MGAADSPDRPRKGPERQNDPQAAPLEERLEAVERAELIGQLAGGVIHDLTNVLTAAVGFCELLLARLEPDSPAYADAKEVHRASEQAVELAREVLTIAAPEQSSFEVVDVARELARMRPMVERFLPPSVRSTLRIQHDLPAVGIDSGSFVRIVLNLCLNARDAMHEGGRLTTEAELVSLDEASARRHELRPGRYVLVTVSDTGTGIDPALIERVFDPFFTTKGQAGTGLGLTSVKENVRRAGGAITITSQPGEWTSVAVHLPVA